jgi:hypothetical protein
MLLLTEFNVEGTGSLTPRSGSTLLLPAFLMLPQQSD